MSDELEAAFLTMVERVRNAEVDIEPSNEEKLQMYALFKQATEGDIHGDKPGMFDMVGRAKYQAWEKVAGMTKPDAMKAYIAIFE